MITKIGIVGGGQLGRMLTIAAKQLGFYVTVIDPTPHSPAGQVADNQIQAEFKDEKAIRKLAETVDVITFEVELANANVLNELQEKGIAIHPSPRTLEIIKDKYKQKEFLRKNKIATADFVEVTSKEDILNAAKKFGYPFLLKAKMDAYDGRGNFVVHKKADIEKGLDKLKNRNLYIEKFVPFSKEIAVMVARNTKGEIAVYPVVQTIHKNNICDTVMAPAKVSLTTKRIAQRLAKKVMKHLKGAGVFGIEMFLNKDGSVLINEIAPRVHNSGHYTMEGSVTSQFEQHIRAITGMPLGKTDLLFPAAAMINILGNRNAPAEVKGLEKALKLPRVSIHIYGKMETRIERKMGHITAIADNINKALRHAKKARRLITI